MRADLPAGLQMAQAVHSAFQISQEHPELISPWHTKSNYLVIVAVPDESVLYGLISTARERGIAATGVREPDLNDEITAVAFQPGAAARRLCANYPLALKEKPLAA